MRSSPRHYPLWRRPSRRLFAAPRLCHRVEGELALGRERGQLVEQTPAGALAQGPTPTFAGTVEHDAGEDRGDEDTPGLAVSGGSVGPLESATAAGAEDHASERIRAVGRPGSRGAGSS